MGETDCKGHDCYHGPRGTGKNRLAILQGKQIAHFSLCLFSGKEERTYV